MSDMSGGYIWCSKTNKMLDVRTPMSHISKVFGVCAKFSNYILVHLYCESVLSE